MESTIVYHETSGPGNTEETLDLAVNAAAVYDLDTIVVASRTGETGTELMNRLEDTNIRMVVVTPQFGWMDEHEFDLSMVPVLREAGHEFHAGTMPFHTDMMHGCSAPKKMGDVLRIFSQGTQVCVEIAMMAADAGLVKCDRRCVAVAGTGRGADTAMVVTPASSSKLEDFCVHEILCKPRLMAEG